MDPEDERTTDATTVSPDTQYTQMAEGLSHRFRDLSLSMNRRDSFVWNLDESGGDLDFTGSGPRRGEE